MKDPPVYVIISSLYGRKGNRDANWQRVSEKDKSISIRWSKCWKAWRLSLRVASLGRYSILYIYIMTMSCCIIHPSHDVGYYPSPHDPLLYTSLHSRHRHQSQPYLFLCLICKLLTIDILGCEENYNTLVQKDSDQSEIKNKTTI